MAEDTGEINWFFLYRKEPDGRYRVWRSTWVGDQFEVLTPEEFVQFSRLTERFGLSATPAGD